MRLLDDIDVLTLKVFFKIAETGNLELLGEGTKEQREKAWEKIIEDYSKRDNNMAIQDVMSKRDELFRQAALFCEVKAMLLYLIGGYKQAYVDRLKYLGYDIDNSDKAKMMQSIAKSDQKSNHIQTRIRFIEKDIEKFQVNEGNKQSFEGVMAWLSFNLKFEPSNNITVGRFLEYKKMINESNKAKRSHRGVRAEMA